MTSRRQVVCRSGTLAIVARFLSHGEPITCSYAILQYIIFFRDPFEFLVVTPGFPRRGEDPIVENPKLNGTSRKKSDPLWFYWSVFIRSLEQNQNYRTATCFPVKSLQFH